METENEKSHEEILDKIEHIEEIQEDNHRMLKKLYHAMQWSRAVRIVYLVLVLSVMFGLYYSIQPYVGGVVDTYLEAQSVFNTFKGVPAQ